MKKLYLIGGGGHCHSCIDVIEDCGEFEISGIFDVKENVGKEVLGYKIIGTDNELSQYVHQDHYFLITIGQIKSAQNRKKVFNQLVKLNVNFAIIVSKRAYVSKHAKLGRGTIVMHDVLVNANAIIGENCILNTKSLIEHDSIIKNHCHISTGAIVNGDCVVEDECFIGSQSVLKEGVVIKANSLISAGVFYNGKS